ncbi:uncharacterized protein LOC123409435 [Hordeum vulgare subsp. vulgare]|uniref:Zinc finger GRF-type domain-containing protein n=1 Tax=Hordeum vulgare subsp. vulgare TaxID=112509 RepID=A0A8I6X220_HORVV|nr:uncharacterized protein LOC123409435 [Hordeum vulgare subsp. vulgare]
MKQSIDDDTSQIDDGDARLSTVISSSLSEQIPDSCGTIVRDEGVVVDELPREIEDPEFFGVVSSSAHKCHHNMHPARKVAFVYASTGRRFLGCPLNGAERCRWVMWIDEPWRLVLSRSIMRLWDESDDRATLLQSKIKELQQAYIELWTERSNFAAEHEQVVSQLTDIIADNKIKMASRLDLHTKLCLASVTVAVTLASVLAYVLSS